MSDKGGTGKKPRPKRDPNKPFPKPSKSKGFVVRAVVSAILVLLSVWVALYSMQIEKIPTNWNSEDWSGFVTFSKAQVDEAKANLEKVDWKKFSDKTKKLWDRVPELEKKLENKLASLREKKAVETPDGASTSGAEGGEGGEKTQPAVVAPPTELELGCEAMRTGIRHYRESMNSQVELKKARTSFEKAQKHLEAAEREAKDDVERQEIRGYLEECQKYLYDCLKLEKV